MQIIRSQTKIWGVRAIARVWDHYKDVRIATKPEDRKFYVPEPRIDWAAESLADIRSDIGRVEVNDKIYLPRARWWPARGEYRIKLRDETGELEFNLDRNPFDLDESPLNQGSQTFGHHVDVPRVLLLALTRSGAGNQIYDIELWMRHVMEDPTKGLDGLSRTEHELRVWNVHLNPGEKRGYDPVRGFRALVEHPDVEEKYLK